MESLAHIAGLQAKTEPSMSQNVRRPLSIDWISDDLLQATLATWSPRYEQPINTEDAIEILTNLKRFSEALLSNTKDNP